MAWRRKGLMSKKGVLAPMCYRTLTTNSTGAIGMHYGCIGEPIMSLEKNYHTCGESKILYCWPPSKTARRPGPRTPGPMVKLPRGPRAPAGKGLGAAPIVYISICGPIRSYHTGLRAQSIGCPICPILHHHLACRCPYTPAVLGLV